jgi:hypothetical protein
LRHTLLAWLLRMFRGTETAGRRVGGIGSMALDEHDDLAYVHGHCQP